MATWHGSKASESTDRDNAPDRVELLGITRGGGGGVDGTRSGHVIQAQTPHVPAFGSSPRPSRHNWRTLPVAQLMQLSNSPPALPE